MLDLKDLDQIRLKIFDNNQTIYKNNNKLKNIKELKKSYKFKLIENKQKLILV